MQAEIPVLRQRAGLPLEWIKDGSFIEREYRHILSTSVGILKRGETRTKQEVSTLVHYLHLGFPLFITDKVSWKQVLTDMVLTLGGNVNVKDEFVELLDESSWCFNAPTLREQVIKAVASLKESPSEPVAVCIPRPKSDKPAIKMTFAASDGNLGCHVIADSSEVVYGVPYCIASCSLLTHMIAHVTGLHPFFLAVHPGQMRVYQNHFDTANSVLERELTKLPRLKINKGVKDILGFTTDNIELVPHEAK